MIRQTLYLTHRAYIEAQFRLYEQGLIPEEKFKEWLLSEENELIL